MTSTLRCTARTQLLQLLKLAAGFAEEADDKRTDEAIWNAIQIAEEEQKADA